MKKLVAVLLLTIAAAMASTAQVPAPAGAFTLEQVLAYPFPDNLVASPRRPRDGPAPHPFTAGVERLQPNSGEHGA